MYEKACLLNKEEQCFETSFICDAFIFWIKFIFSKCTNWECIFIIGSECEAENQGVNCLDKRHKDILQVHDQLEKVMRIFHERDQRSRIFIHMYIT